MLKKTFLAAAFLCFAFAAQASDLIEVRLKGINSEGYETLLRQNLEAMPEAEMAEVDSVTGRAFISVKEGFVLPDSVLTERIEQAGFKVLGISRSGNAPLSAPRALVAP